MPGHAGSPFWASVDFDSDGEENSAPSPNQRIYLDPWDNQSYGLIHNHREISHEEVINDSSLGEPVSASFYYVPTKSHDSEEDSKQRLKKISLAEMPAPDHAIYGRKQSKQFIPDYHSDMAIYNERVMQIRRRSMYAEEPIYEHRPMLYEPLYGPMLMPPIPNYLPAHPRPRVSLPHHPDYAMVPMGYGPVRRPSRYTEPIDHYSYESLSPEYEDWSRPFPKAVPGNFHLSRYGHLQIDYSCSWNSLDRLIRNK